jgi:L-lactate permease
VSKLIGVALALLPLVVTMTAILAFRVKTHWAGLLGTALTWIVAIGYSKTDPYLLPLAWIYGILVPISYFLVSIATWLMTYHMMFHGCFEDIQEAIKRMPGGTVYKVFFLCFGLGTMMLSSGAGFTWLAVVLNDMGISPWALSILIEGSADPFTQYAYYATPVTVPTLLFGREYGFTIDDLMPMFNRFFWITIPGFALAMLWVLKQDGHRVTRKSALGAVLFGLTLAAIVNVLNLTVDIMAVGILTGAAGMGILYLAQRAGVMGSSSAGEAAVHPPLTEVQKKSLYRSIAPLVLVSILASVWGSFGKPIERAIGSVMIPVVADQAVPFKLVQPFIWPAVTVLVMFTFLRPSKESWRYIGKLFKERWAMRWVATWMFAGMVFAYHWSGKVVIDGMLVLPPGREDLNLLTVLAKAAVGAGLKPYICIVPFMSMFATTLLGTELTSTTFFTPFHFIAARILGFDRPTAFLAGHIVANIGITDIRKLMKNVTLIGAYGEEYKALRRTFIIGFIITAATIIPLMSFLIWP